MIIHVNGLLISWLICIWVTIWGAWTPAPRGYYTYGVATLLSALFRGSVVVITWLAVWLIYFMIRDFSQLT